MYCEYFEALIESSTFKKLPKEIQEFLSSIMSLPAETSIGGEALAIEGIAQKVAMVAEGATLKIASIEVPIEVPKSLSLPRPWPSLTKEGQKIKNDKHKVPHPMRTSPKKYPHKGKPTVQEKGNLIGLQPEEDIEEIPMNEEDIDMGWRMLTLRDPTLSLNYTSTFLHAEERERF